VNTDEHKLRLFLLLLASDDNLVCVPVIAGLGVPFWNREVMLKLTSLLSVVSIDSQLSSQARGSFFGMGLSTTRAQLVHAVLEGESIWVMSEPGSNRVSIGIAWQVTFIIESIKQMNVVGDQPITIDRLRVDGGLTNSKYLMQLQADTLGIPVEVN